MRMIDFPPLGRRLPQFGFGCGRLTGRSTLKQSARLIETALELGIRYFDVAPFYGMGTAEEVLGEVIGNSRDVVIATKVGIARPAYSARTNLLRRFGKPVLDRVRFLKTMARKAYVRPLPPAAAVPPPFDFSRASITASLEESLRLLRRDAADVFLAHDPPESAMTPQVAAAFQDVCAGGLAKSFGVGVDQPEDRWPAAFGSIWQSRWPGDQAVRAYPAGVTRVFHGSIRVAEKSASGATVVPAARIIRQAADAAPDSIILISTSTPARLRALLAQ
jgi:aryl-alcohol dehydrogenase-like predicted oxidoreductase